MSNEGIMVDRAIEHRRRSYTGAAQASDKHGGLPVSMRHARPQPFAPPATALASCHVGHCPGLVDDHQPFGIEIELAVEPRLPALQDVGAVLLGSMRRLFRA